MVALTTCTAGRSHCRALHNLSQPFKTLDGGISQSSEAIPVDTPLTD